MSFTVYRSIRDGFNAAIMALEGKINDVADEMSAQALDDLKMADDKKKFIAGDYYKGLAPEQKQAELAKFDKDPVATNSTTLLALDLQMYVQEWSFMLTIATNTMKTFGDGLLSVARNM